MENKTVLIVDDADFIRTVLKDILQKHNYTVAGEAVNGAEGVKRYFELKPDIVIMDIRMAEESDGISAVKKIKETDKNASVIMLSALSFLTTVLEALQAGADNFVIKPFQADCLLDAIAKVMEGHCRYNAGTVTGLLSDSEFKSRCPKSPVSQAIVDGLLNICSGEYTSQSPEIVEFVDSLH